MTGIGPRENFRRNLAAPGRYDITEWDRVIYGRRWRFYHCAGPTGVYVSAFPVEAPGARGGHALVLPHIHRTPTGATA